MSPVDTINQGLIVMFRGYASPGWRTISENDRLKLQARAKTLIALGETMLRRLEVKPLCQKP